MRLYEVDKCRGYENPHVYVDALVDLYKTYNGWIVEDVITGREVEFTSKEDAEAYAASVESWYIDGPPDFVFEREY